MPEERINKITDFQDSEILTLIQFGKCSLFVFVQPNATLSPCRAL